MGNDFIKILLIEDNIGDIRLTEEALKEAEFKNELFVCQNGQAGLDFLNKEGEYSDAVRPDIIFLDLNMPKKNGREVLEEIKADAALKTIPVIVLTTSASDVDILKTYEVHANSYIQKPVDMDKFIDVVKGIGDYWARFVKLP